MRLKQGVRLEVGLDRGCEEDTSNRYSQLSSNYFSKDASNYAIEGEEYKLGTLEEVMEEEVVEKVDGGGREDGGEGGGGGK